MWHIYPACEFDLEKIKMQPVLTNHRKPFTFHATGPSHDFSAWIEATGPSGVICNIKPWHFLATLVRKTRWLL